MSIGIYKITNPKGKIYIGQSINIERRFKEYKKLYCSQSRKLYYSLKKYGVENHLFEIIEECDIILLNEREEYYILLFKSHINGLNIKLASKPAWTGLKRPDHSILMRNKKDDRTLIVLDATNGKYFFCKNGFLIKIVDAKGCRNLGII